MEAKESDPKSARPHAGTKADQSNRFAIKINSQSILAATLLVFSPQIRVFLLLSAVRPQRTGDKMSGARTRCRGRSVSDPLGLRPCPVGSFHHQQKKPKNSLTAALLMCRLRYIYPSHSSGLLTCASYYSA